VSSPSRAVRYTAVGIGAVYALALYLSDVRLDGHVKQGLAYLPAASALVVVAFDLWLWKLPGVHRLVSRPRIDGTWYCVLTPSSESHIPDGGNWGPIESAVLIEQTYWSLSVTTMTGESRSISTSAQLRKSNGSSQQHVLAYTYANEPGQHSQPRSQPHVGASELAVVGRMPTQVTGKYWTARFTAGVMALRYVNRRTDFPTCEAALNAVPGDVRASWLRTCED
jgi:4-amino-4-deoxy-L-arabinose transferase-like glycosyltransferase